MLEKSSRSGSISGRAWTGDDSSWDPSSDRDPWMEMRGSVGDRCSITCDCRGKCQGKGLVGWEGVILSIPCQTRLIPPANWFAHVSDEVLLSLCIQQTEWQFWLTPDRIFFFCSLGASFDVWNGRTFLFNIKNNHISIKWNPKNSAYFFPCYLWRI